jgi:hypothetical protein
LNARAGGRRPEPIEKKIGFYRYSTYEEAGRLRRLRACAIIDAVADAEDYVALPSDLGIQITVPAGTDRLVLQRVRWTGHPQRYRIGGATRPLGLRPDEGLTEPTHFRFFADNVVGVELNRHGPPPSWLLDVVAKVPDDEFTGFRLVRILDVTALERLNSIVIFKSMEVRLSRRTIARLDPHDNDFVPILQRAGELVTDGGVFEFGWKPFRNNGELNAEALKNLAVAILEGLDEDDVGDPAAQIAISGKDQHGVTQTYALRRDYIVALETVRRTQDNRIDPGAMFAAIERAHAAVRGRFAPQDFIDEH